MRYAIAMFTAAAAMFIAIGANSVLEQQRRITAARPVQGTIVSSEVRELMSGHEVSEISKDHIFPYQIAKYVKYEYEWVWYFRMLPLPWFRWLEKRLGWHTLITARPKAAALA